MTCAVFCALALWVCFIGWTVSHLKDGEIKVERWIKGNREQVVVGPSSDNWLELDNISLYAVYAILVSEDSRFYQHWGIDTVEIAQSMKLNWQRKKIIRGASTITQQVVKLAFLHNRRTWTRKVQEIVGAIVLEQQLDKQQILTWYLNLVPFGHDVYGIEQGARQFFQKSAELLTIEDGAMLAMVIPSPNPRSRDLRNELLEDAGQRRYYGIVSKMRDRGFITHRQWAEAIAKGNFGNPIHHSAQ